MTRLIAFIRKWYEISSQKQRNKAVLFAVGLLCTLGLLFFQAGSDPGSTALQSNPLYFLSVFLKLIAVLLLIVVSSVVFRRWLQPGPGGRKFRHMQLMETVRLSPKQALHLVSIGDQQFLIGATDQNLSLISPVELDLQTNESEPVNPQPVIDFASLLQAMNLRFPSATSK